MKSISGSLAVVLCGILLSSCATTFPDNLLRLSENSMEMRQLQIRRFDSNNEHEIIAAAAGVLQDMGYMLDDSETELGVIVASKDRDATNAGQVALATMAVALSAFGGTASNAFDYVDDVQKIRASVVSTPSKNGEQVNVRVTFQRVVWNKVGNVSRMETLSEPELYQGFFTKLSKSIFLEGQNI